MNPSFQYPNFSISIVIPLYNEETRVPLLLISLYELRKKRVFDFECILVDDGSTDNTVNIINTNTFIQQLRSENKCSVITQKCNKGKGEALKTGVELAKMQYILTMDADVATHPLEIVNWLEKENGIFKNKTIYIGSREHINSNIKSGFTRRFIGRVFNLIVRYYTKLNLKDTQCGFKLYPLAIGKRLFHELINTGWAHDIELLCRAKNERYDIKEMEITWSNGERGKISLIKDPVRMFIETIKIARLFKK